MNRDKEKLLNRKAEIETIIEDIETQIRSKKNASPEWKRRATTALKGYRESLAQVNLYISHIEKEEEKQFQQIFCVKFHVLCQKHMSPEVYARLKTKAETEIQNESEALFRNA